jgi:exodeoxyribonuclease III
MLKIATWNVNGIRARQAQVQEFVGNEQPDILCLQEIKASPAQVPAALCEMEGYWCYWHGDKGYSGVGLHVKKDSFPDRPVFSHPSFDYEHRIVVVQAGNLSVASVYVPNGGKDFPAKMRFLHEMESYTANFRRAGAPLVLCGDMNVAREERDVHPKERKANCIGQLPEERDLFNRIISEGLVDLGRAKDPENDNLFTWWPPWRNMRQRNIGWRLDYLLVSEELARRANSCRVEAQVGTSDHAPVVALFEVSPVEFATSTDPSPTGPTGPSVDERPADRLT